MLNAWLVYRLLIQYMFVSVIFLHVCVFMYTSLTIVFYVGPIQMDCFLNSIVYAIAYR